MDMSVELIVFLGIGMILLGLITAFVYDWDFSKDVDTLKEMYGETKAPLQIKMNKQEFITRAREFWDYCNHSYVNETKAYYVYNEEANLEGSITKEDMFSQYKSLGWCKNIQSVNLSCGTREDVNMTQVLLPRIVRLRCENNTLFVR